MDAKTIIIVTYAILAVIGLVCIYFAYDMKTNGNLKIGFFVGQEIKKERCKDIPGFINATYKPIMILGVPTVIISIAMIILSGILDFGSVKLKLIQLVSMIIIIGLFLWFNKKVNKATEEYIK